MIRTGLLLVVGLTALAVALVLMAPLTEEPAMALDAEPAWAGQGDPYTVRLPLMVRGYNPSYMSPFGVIMYGSVDNASGLAVMRDAGTKWVTMALYWSEIENTPDRYWWSTYDTKAQNAQGAGMDLFVLFTGNPSWAAALPGGPVTDTQNLVDFVTLMAERYDGDGSSDAPGNPSIRYWSFYAEPDHWNLGYARGGRGYWGHNGAGYAAMLAAVSPAIHAANPEAQVLIGGLAYDSFEEEGGPIARSFLTDTLAALNTYPGGAAAYIDAIAFHYYAITPSRWPTLREKAQEIRGIMVNHGIGDLPLLVPEYGYWSSPKWGSSPIQQAYWLVQNSVRGLSVDIRMLSWYRVRDAAVAGSLEDSWPDRTAGLLEVDDDLKPSYYAYQMLTRELERTSYAGPFVAAGVEGYVFVTPAGQQKTVLWSQAGTVRVAFPYTHLRVAVVTATGTEYDIRDNRREGGAPGDLDGGQPGQIVLELYENQPIYVERK